MPVTLAQVSLNSTDALQKGVIDEFRKSSFLLEKIPFEQCVSPQGGGATLTYSYLRVKTEAAAAFRAMNSEYTASEAVKEKISADLKIFGGSYEVDRVLADLGGAVNEIDFQSKQKVKSTAALFNDTFINGDSGTNTDAFDGLEKALAGSSTEFTNDGTAIDLSSASALDSNYMYFLDALDEFLSELDAPPSFIGGNTKLVAKLRACIRRASMYTSTRNELGQLIEQYGNIPIIDFGAKSGSNEDIVATKTDGTTSLYAGRFGLDGVHAISLSGSNPVKIILPDFKTAGAVKKGEIEMVAAIALKSSKSAGVMRNIKVKAAVQTEDEGGTD